MNMQVIMDKYVDVIEIWCLILSTYLIYVSTKAKALEYCEKKKTQKYIYLTSMTILVCDMQTYIFAGNDSILAYWIIQVSSCMLYLLKYIYLTVFTMFIMKDSKKHVLVKKILLMASALIGVIGMVCLSIPGVREEFYYFDSDNYFYYGRLYWVIRFFFMLDALILLIALLVEKKQYRRKTFYLYLGYILNLDFMGFLDYYVDAWYMQNMAIFFSTIIIFIDNMFRVSEQWLDTKKELYVSEYKASHDLMTDVWNKAGGIEQIEKCLSNMIDIDTAIIGFIDIDDFKAVNDTYGHETGDFWIVQVAETLKDISGIDDILCRYGGDEFIIFLKDVHNTEELVGRMERFKEIMCKKSELVGQEVHCSIGLYKIKGAKKTLADCIFKADELVYKAKENGKNTYVIG